MIPKDRTILIKPKGYPWYCIAHWHPVQEQFIYAYFQAGLFEGEFNDYYFENEFVKEEEITEWKELE